MFDSQPGMFELLKQDHARARSRPVSWWNLAQLAPLLLFVGLSLHSWWNDAQIAKRQNTAIGIIDGHDPPNHNRYSYSFTVNRRRFTGWASPTDKRDFSIGQQIVVYYDPLQPSQNSAYDFNDVNPGVYVFTGFVLLACLCLPAYIHFQRRSRKSAPGTSLSG